MLDIGRGRNSVNWVTRSSAEGHPFRGELHAGVFLSSFFHCGCAEVFRRVRFASATALSGSLAKLTIPPSCVQKFLVWPLSSQGNRGASVPLFRWPPRIWDRRGSRRGSSESYTRPRACCIQSGAELYPPGTEDDFKLQTANSKGGSSSGQTCEVDIGKKWLSTQHQTIKKQVTCNPLERNVTKNTAQPWWIAPETTKEMESCLEKIDLGVSRKRRHWATQQKAEVN